MDDQIPEPTDPITALEEYRDIYHNIAPLMHRLQTLEAYIKDCARKYKANYNIHGAYVRLTPGRPYTTLPKEKWEKLAKEIPAVAEQVETKEGTDRVTIKVL